MTKTNCVTYSDFFSSEIYYNHSKNVSLKITKNIFKSNYYMILYNIRPYLIDGFRANVILNEFEGFRGLFFCQITSGTN
jgi:hypothetical protein